MRPGTDVTRGCARCGDRQLLFDWNIFRKDGQRVDLTIVFKLCCSRSRITSTLSHQRHTFLREVKTMIRIPRIASGLIASWPSLALAEEFEGSYRGIGSIYFTLIGAILIYGVYDSFGKRAAYIVGPLIVIGLYVMLPTR